MITITEESARSFFKDAEPLFQANWEEVGVHKKVVKLLPDYEAYLKMEARGQFVVIAVRDEGKLIGYSLWVVKYPMHYATKKVASNDVIFILPEYRGGLGGKLMDTSEHILKQKGVVKMIYHVKVRHDWSHALEAKGYEKEEILLTKLLTENENGL